MKDGPSRARAELAGSRVLVVGLGASGASVCRFLLGCGALVTATDLLGVDEIPVAAELARLGVGLSLGGYPAPGTLSASVVVVSPGVPSDIELLKDARAAGADVISDVELAYRYMDAPIIAVAGTNGKTTTTALLGHLLKSAGKDVFVGGNIGTPAIEGVEAEPRPECSVLEISSFHLETTSTFAPHIAVLLNITPDHLDRHQDFDNYAATKMRLFTNQGPGDWAVVNALDPVITEWIEREGARASVISFGAGVAEFAEGGVAVRPDLFLRDDNIVFVRPGTSFEELYPAQSGRLRGLHNIENTMAAVAAARLAGLSPDELKAGLASFVPLPHRMESVRELDGVEYIDDSKGTNTGALAMALKGIGKGVVLIAGGRDKGADFASLAGIVKEKVRLLILIGEAADRIEEELGASVETLRAETLESAVMSAHERARSGETVLLSPACSSFDMFTSYKERGLKFRALVEGL